MIRKISGAFLIGIVALTVFSVIGTGHQTATRYDYLERNLALIRAGQQALLTCNGLFVSNRNLDQIYEAELKLDLMPLAPPNEVKIDRDRKTVAIGNGSGLAPTMRAVHREGLGCVVLG